jgi:hypothetical protein
VRKNEEIFSFLIIEYDESFLLLFIYTDLEAKILHFVISFLVRKSDNKKNTQDYEKYPDLKTH